MSSQIRFVMHPDDEKAFVAALVAEEGVHLIDGPRWKSQVPRLARSIEEISGDHCIVWCGSDGAPLQARLVEASGHWYCTSEQTTLQFLRSCMEDDLITEGRLALGDRSDDAESPADKLVLRRFHRLRDRIRKTYTNKLARWSNPGLPFRPAGPGRFANPSPPDAQLWIGPGAIAWLRERPGRSIRQDLYMRVEAVIDADAR
jgi:hypothetical protein